MKTDSLFENETSLLKTRHAAPSSGADGGRVTAESSRGSKTDAPPHLDAVKAAHKATWESGDFGQIARTIEDFAEEFMGRLSIKPGARVLDVACGTGNLAIIAARHGCQAMGLDIASNLIAQARLRAATEKLPIEFVEGDAEALPYGDGQFDFVVSSFGVMFTPRPDCIVSELRRVTRPGGQIALASWTLEGFIGEMFKIFKKHLPPPPLATPSPLEWGNESVVRSRLGDGFEQVRLTRRIARMRYAMTPAETVEFFRKYYGPTYRAFASLNVAAQDALRQELVRLETDRNVSSLPGTTEIAAEYLEVVATRR